MDRKGSCLQCGKCCKTKYIYSAMNWRGRLRLHFQLWKRGARFDRESQCGFLKNWINGKYRCGKYKDRPIFCQLFPCGSKDLIPGCGYKFEKEQK